MLDKLKKLLDFPYPPEYEAGYNKEIMKSMHKPLLVALTATLMFITWLVGICIFFPEYIASPEYLDGVLSIHFVFMIFTIMTLLVAVSMRRQLFQYPAFHVILCNIYAVGICIWASVLSAYANYSATIYSAFTFVVLCVSMIALFKPWLAIVVFTSNYFLYLTLFIYFDASFETENTLRFTHAAFASILAIVISFAFYRFRTRTYYDKQVIAKQMDKINSINRQLQMLIHKDNLTGLFNRRFYEEVLPVELEIMSKSGSFCCMMLDIDFFKSYNDYYGHPAGDDCLRTVTRLIVDVVNEDSGFTIRYGGEEFFIVVKIDSEQDAFFLADSIRSTIERAYIPHASAPLRKVTVSCGVVYCEEGETYDIDVLTKKADEALYSSKQNGRNQVTLYR